MSEENQPEQAKEGSNKPVQSFKAGTVEVSIWGKVVEVEGREKTFYNITWHRDYKSKEGEWKSTNSLDVHDIPKLKLVLDKAYEWIMLKK